VTGWATGIDKAAARGPVSGVQTIVTRFVVAGFAVAPREGPDDMAGRDDTHRLGWLGVGRMGVEMGRRLLEAGCDLAVFNRSMGKAEPLIRLGAKPAGSAAELAARDIVFITVGSSDDLISAVLGPEGLMSAPGAPPRVLVDCSTVSA